MKQGVLKLSSVVIILFIGVLSDTGFTSEVIVFEDDFQYYDVEDATDFSIGGTPTGNWTVDPDPLDGDRASEIYDTSNFGGSRLWISIEDGTSITSRPISVQSNTDYVFSAFMAVETGNPGRQVDVTYDLLIGQDVGSAVSLLAGPVTVIVHSDPYLIDDSKEDHVFSESFTTGTLNAGDKLFIVVTRIGTTVGASGGYLAVDDIIVQTPPLQETDYAIMFSDDFQAYSEVNPATAGDMDNNWDPIDPNANASRIFETNNFSGTKLWISNIDGSGIVSRAIELQSETDYTFSAMIASETSTEGRKLDVEYDLIIADDSGVTSGTPYSILGGPQAVVTDGDDWSVPNSKVDHIFESDFTTPVLSSNERLYVTITRIGVNAGSSAWLGVDDVLIQETPIIKIEGLVSNSVTEGDATGLTYQVILNRAPSQNVTVTVNPISGGSGKNLDMGNGPGVPVDLVFTTSDWQTPQPVTVIAYDDDIIEGYQDAQIIHLSSSFDSEFDAFYRVEEIEIVDNDMPIIATNAFVNGEGGHNVYRIQTMTVCNDGSVVVAAEGRPSFSDPGYSGDIALTVRRSPDGGVTWGPYFDIQDDVGYDFSDPRLVTDAATGRVHLLYTRWHTLIGQASAGVGLGDDTSNTFYAYSDDHGFTWTTPVNITAQVKDPTWKVINTGPGIATQLKFQTDPNRNGRLIMAAHRINGSGQYAGAPICSDDNGATWYVAGETDSASMNESEVVELTNGDLMWDARPGGGTRKRFDSSDGGATWGDMYYSDVPSVVCAYGLDRFSAKREGDDRDRILYSGPLGNPHLSASGRVDVGVWTSYDEGKTFINPVEIERAYAAYTLVDKMSNGNVGVFYEYGTTGSYQKIRLVQFPMTMLEGGSHSDQMLSYDGFNNSIDRKRGGIGFSGLWLSNADFTDEYTTVFDGSSISYAGLALDTLNGRADIGGGEFAVRQLAYEIDLDTNATTYISMLISCALDGTPDDSVGEELAIELQDAGGTTHCSFGVDSDEAVVINAPGTPVAGTADAVDLTSSYFIVAKLVADTSGDQLFVKVFESGEPVSDAELNDDWTLVGDDGTNSNAIIDRIRISSGFAATWSVDEIRVGESYASVAYADDTFMLADINRNYYVNTGDVMAMATQWLESTDCQTYLLSDIDESCRVDLGDFARLSLQWLNCNDPTDPINCSN